MRAIVVDNGETKAVIVSFNLGGLYKPEELTESLSEQLEIPKENIILAATHNHTGLMPFNVNGLYQVRLVRVPAAERKVDQSN